MADNCPQHSVATLASDNSATSAADRFETEAMPHVNDIFRTATRILGDRARAEDVAQEVYLQAWKSFHRFEPGTNCRAWLFKILFHCVNHHRRKWFRSPPLKETEEFIETNLPCAEPIPEHLTDEDILAALDRIPDEFRAVILMVDVNRPRMTLSVAEVTIRYPAWPRKTPVGRMAEPVMTSARISSEPSSRPETA